MALSNIEIWRDKSGVPEDEVLWYVIMGLINNKLENKLKKICDQIFKTFSNIGYSNNIY